MVAQPVKFFLFLFIRNLYTLLTDHCKSLSRHSHSVCNLKGLSVKFILMLSFHPYPGLQFEVFCLDDTIQVLDPSSSWNISCWCTVYSTHYDDVKNSCNTNQYTILQCMHTIFHTAPTCCGLIIWPSWWSWYQDLFITYSNIILLLF